jgi:hypothetical protein
MGTMDLDRVETRLFGPAGCGTELGDGLPDILQIHLLGD